MKDLKIVGNDLVLAQDFALVSDTDQIAQSAKLILLTRLGDFALEPEFGLDVSNILTKQIVSDYVKRDVEVALVENSEQISGIDNVEITQDRITRNLTFSFDLLLTTGEKIETEVELNAG